MRSASLRYSSGPAPVRRSSAERVSVVGGVGALELLDRRWDDLLLRVPLPNPLLSAAWLRALARWDPAVDPLVAVVESDGALVAAAALQVRRAGGRLGQRIATWLGPPQQLHSPDALVDGEHAQTGERLMDALLDEVDVLSLPAVAAAGSTARALAAVAPWRLATPAYERWLLAVPPPRLEYMRKQAAYDLRRAARRGAEVEVRTTSAPDDVHRALVRFFRVHRERWRNRPEAEEARFATTRAHRRFNAHAIAAMAEHGRARLVEVVEDGRVVACSLGFVYGGGAVGHTTAVRLGGNLRQPGHLATLARAEALAAGGATVIDLGCDSGSLGGSKLRLGPEPDPLVHLFAARTRARQRGYAAIRALRDHTRRTARRWS